MDAKRFFKIYTVIAVIFITIVSLVEGVWIFHASPWEIFLATLILMGAAALGGWLGFLIYKKLVYKYLHGQSEKKGENE